MTPASKNQHLIIAWQTGKCNVINFDINITLPEADWQSANIRHVMKSNVIMDIIFISSDVGISKVVHFKAVGAL